MGQGYFRNIDDSVSDPTLIGSQYQIGRNAYFEVSLTLAEYADSLDSLRGGVVGSPDLAQSLAGAYGGIGVGCPEISQYVWIDDHKAIRAKRLKVGMSLYNPITRNFNKLNTVEILKNQPLMKIGTQRGVENIVSLTHKVIKNTADSRGTSLLSYGTGLELLSWEAKGDKNIYGDTLVEMTDAGFGDVVRVSLDAEFIYASGMTKTKGVLGHNRKDENGELI